MTKSKSFDKNPKHRALYHALIESILENENAIDKGVTDKLKKRKLDDADRDEDPPAGSDQGLKRRKTSKDVKPSKKFAQAEETMFEAGDTQLPHNLREDIGKTDEIPIIKDDLKDWFQKPKRPLTPDPEWNTGKTVNDGPTQNWLSDLAKADQPPKMFNELMSTPIDFTAFAMNRLQISDLTKADLNNHEGYRYPFDLSKPLPLLESRNHLIILADYFFNNDLAYLQGGSTDITYTTSLTKTKAAKYDLQGIENMVPMLWSPIKVSYNRHALLGEAIMHLAAALRMFTRRIVIQKRVEDLQLGVESYQNKLNISRPLTHKAGISDLEPYIVYSNPQGVIYLDKLEINKMMCTHELYKFIDSTLISVQDKLKDMANNLELGYNSVMPRRRWSNLDKKWSRIMVKDIDLQLLERRLLRSLEKFVGVREYGEDLRLL
ncbi:hypothetical protein Tco_0445458 [Tanacetum coccineum]